MRQGQQNRRGRGRGGSNSNSNSSPNNGNRKTQNPLSRTYESNGPDVKIRGTAAQIAEKYTTLSRDASSSGDRVVAENYLQHAEHYNRIIAAAQAASLQTAANNGVEAGHGMNGSQRPPREPNQNLRDQPQPHFAPHPGSEPQPVIPERGQSKAEAAQPAEKSQAAEAQPPADTDGNGNTEDRSAANGEGQAEKPRRRRRYPSATGTGSARAASADGSESGATERPASGNVAEKQSSDEATA